MAMGVDTVADTVALEEVATVVDSEEVVSEVVADGAEVDLEEVASDTHQEDTTKASLWDCDP